MSDRRKQKSRTACPCTWLRGRGEHRDRRPLLATGTFLVRAPLLPFTFAFRSQPHSFTPLALSPGNAGPVCETADILANSRGYSRTKISQLNVTRNYRLDRAATPRQRERVLASREATLIALARLYRCILPSCLVVEVIFKCRSCVLASCVLASRACGSDSFAVDAHFLYPL